MSSPTSKTCRRGSTNSSRKRQWHNRQPKGDLHRETTETPREDIVTLLLDTEWPRHEGQPDAIAAIANRELRHLDGRPLTENDYELVLQASKDEFLEVARRHRAVANQMAQEVDDHSRVVELMTPYVDRHGEELTNGQAYLLMTPEEQAEMDEIVNRNGGWDATFEIGEPQRN